MGFYLALALLMVPLLGLMHGIVHDHDHADASLSQRSSQPGWSKALFADHESAADCLVFDQLCHADALHFLPLPALPTTLTSVVLVTLAGDFIARWAALYQARGPPSAR